MKRLLMTLPIAALLLSGCAVYDAGPVYPGGYYAPPARVYAEPAYVYPRYVAPPVYGSVWFGGGRGHYGGGRGYDHLGDGHSGRGGR